MNNYKWHKDTSWQEIIFYLILAVVMIGLAVGISFLCTRCTQNQMDGGLIIDKYMTEGHYQTYSSYNSSQKRYEVRNRWIPTSYTLVVQKTIGDGVKIKEVPVSIEVYYYSEVGEIYTR